MNKSFTVEEIMQKWQVRNMDGFTSESQAVRWVIEAVLDAGEVDYGVKVVPGQGTTFLPRKGGRK